MTTAETYESTGRRGPTASPYRQWQDTQGIPIYTGSYVEDLYAIELEPPPPAHGRLCPRT